MSDHDYWLSRCKEAFQRSPEQRLAAIYWTHRKAARSSQSRIYAFLRLTFVTVMLLTHVVAVMLLTHVRCADFSVLYLRYCVRGYVSGMAPVEK